MFFWRLQEVRYAEKDHYFGEATIDSSINSSEASMGVDDYLDEALDENVDDGDDDITQDDEEDDENNSRLSRGVSCINNYCLVNGNLKWKFVLFVFIE